MHERGLMNGLQTTVVGPVLKEFKPLCPRKVYIANILFNVMDTNSDHYPTYADYARRSLLWLRIVTGLSEKLFFAIVIRGITDSQIRATNANFVPNDLVKLFSIYMKVKSSTSKSDLNKFNHNQRDHFIRKLSDNIRK